MIRQCAWCSRFQGVQKPILDFSVTHVMCKTCFKEEKRKLGIVRNLAEINKKARLVCRPTGLNEPQRSDSNGIYNKKYSIKQKN